MQKRVYIGLVHMDVCNLTSLSVFLSFVTKITEKNRKELQTNERTKWKNL